MKSATRAIIFSAVALFAISGCGGGSDGAADGNMAAVDEDSPEFAAMQYRQGLMHVLGYKIATLRDMAEGAIEADDAVFAKYAADLATAAHMILEGFEGMEASSTDALPGSGPFPTSGATGTISRRKPRSFRQRRMKLTPQPMRPDSRSRRIPPSPWGPCAETVTARIGSVSDRPGRRFQAN